MKSANCTRAVKTLSLLLAAAAVATAADITVQTDVGAFVFRDAKAWRFSEGRQEMIPELAATLDNRTGLDWQELIFQVDVPCPQSPQQSFPVKLIGVEPGSRAVRVTAFDAIGRVAYCESSGLNITFLGGAKAPANAVPSYLVLGFSYRAGDAPPSLQLDGIYDTRRAGDSQGPTRPVFWRDGGETLGERGTAERIAYYAFRVEPGDLGLSGFLRSRENPTLEHYLRWFTVPPGKAVFAGTFEVEHSTAGLLSVIASRDPAGFEWLKASHPEIRGRELILPPLRPPEPLRTRILVK
jgi:hypothetical protein